MVGSATGLGWVGSSFFLLLLCELTRSGSVFTFINPNRFGSFVFFNISIHGCTMLS